MSTLRTKESLRIAKANPCPECKSNKSWVRGGVPSRKGIKRRLICVMCGKTYYPKGEDMWVEKF